MSNLTQAERDALDAATFRRLLKHLDENRDVQNIDLMILANFCRNCLSKWWLAEGEAQGHAIDLDDARQRCLLYTSPSPRDRTRSRMPSSA